jgi:hypothetical protein
MQDGIQRTLAAIQSYRKQFAEHRSLCQQNEERFRARLEAARSDLPRAQSIVDLVLTDCKSGGESEAILQCTLPSGELLNTFGSSELQSKAAELSGPVEELLSRSLSNVIRPLSSTSLLSIKTKVTRRVASLKKLGKYGIPSEWCTTATAPPCPAFEDGMSFFSGWGGGYC